MTGLASDRVLTRLSQLHPKKIDLSLGRIERLLAALGNPQEKLPPVIHVAGTKGKGSTVAIMRACLEAAGYHVHAYISPHLVRFHERIRLAGTLIGEDALICLLEECERANRGEPITFFEITNAAAFLAFARVPADIVLLEVGVGGRLDSTNVVRHPAVTAITPVSLDHQALLGDTIAAIAGEKAGILKPGVVGVIAPQPAAAAAAIADRAAAIGAPLYRCGTAWRCDAAADGMRYAGERWRLDLPPPSLLGAHQIVNAGAAIACLEQLRDFTLTLDNVAAGVTGARWPARLQRLTKGPLAAMIPTDWQLWLDGAHNPHGAAALAAWIAAQARPVHLVTAMLDTKDATGFFTALAGKLASVRTVPVPGEAKSLDPAALAAAATRAGLDARPARDPAAAIAELVAAAPRGPALLVIAGSLYLAGTVLAENG